MHGDRDQIQDDHLFGTLAVQKFYLTQQEANAALEKQREYLARGVWKRLGSILIAEGLLTPDQVTEILALQKSRFLSCSGCNARFNVRGMESGRRFICKRCKTVLVVPALDGSIHANETFPMHESVPEAEGLRSALMGRVIGGCRIDKMIGRGGMGAVYEATQMSLNRKVALKILPESVGDDEMYIARFEREARIVASLSHPHIVQVHDMGMDRTSGLYYIVMEYVEGGSIGQKLGTPVPEDQALRYVIDTAEGLETAHRENILHRDIKPDNLLLDRYGRVKIADFGLARGVKATVNLTGSGAALGTPAFMSPEQGMGEPVDHRSDLYSLGATLFTILTSSYCYEADSPIGMVVKHANDPVPRVRKKAPHVSPETEDLICRALAKRPEERFQSAGEFVRAARAVLSGEARKVRPSDRTARAAAQPRRDPRRDRKTDRRAAGPAQRRAPKAAGARPGSSRTESVPEGTKTLVYILGSVVALLVLALTVIVAVTVARSGRRTDGEGDRRAEEPPKPAKVEAPAPDPPLAAPAEPQAEPASDAVAEALMKGAVTSNLAVPAGEYRIQRDLNVAEGVTLELFAGVTFLFAPEAGVYCRGRLVAKGTPSAPVRFGPQDSEQGWRNITLDGDGTKGSSMEHGVILGGRGRTYPGSNDRISSGSTVLKSAKENSCGGGIAVIGGASVNVSFFEVRRCMSEMYGGGIYVSFAQTFLSDCRVLDNESYHGGGLGSTSGLVRIERCTFEGNSANTGGAFSTADDSTFSILKSRFCSNSALEKAGCGMLTRSKNVFVDDTEISEHFSKAGGAFRLTESLARFKSCVLTRNRASYEDGGALCCEKGSLELEDCSFEENQAFRHGGAVFAKDTETLGCTGCTFKNNRAAWGGACFPENVKLRVSNTRFMLNRSKDGGAILWRGIEPVIGEGVEYEGNYPNNTSQYGF